MAGLGRRTFQAGEVLTASNVMAYLQDQAVMNFAGTAARGSAIGTAVSEGMVSYLADNNFVQAYDGTAWRSLSGVQVASGTATRDALLPSPVQGDKVFRNDLGYEQTYYAAAGTANPGGRGSGGWFDNQRNMGLVPIVPPTIRLGGGSATVNTVGKVSFTSTNAIILDSIFSSSYSHYRIIFNTTSTSANAALICRFTTSGTPNSTSNYYGASNYGASNGGFGGYTTTNPQTYGVVNELIASGYTNLKTTSILDFNVESNGASFYHMSKGFPVAFSGFLTGGYLFNSISTGFDGFQFTTLTSANLTGTVQVFGYNN